jgi:hypothetical protein
MEEGVGKNVLNKIRRKKRGKNVPGKTSSENVPQSGGGS